MKPHMVWWEGTANAHEWSKCHREMDSNLKDAMDQEYKTIDRIRQEDDEKQDLIEAANSKVSTKLKEPRTLLVKFRFMAEGQYLQMCYPRWEIDHLWTQILT